MPDNKIWEGWEEQSMSDNAVHDFKKTPVLKGVFIQKRENIGPNGSNMYTFEVADTHERVDVWGNTLLDARLSGVMAGEEVGLEYLGKEKSEKTGREFHNYKVFRRPITEV